MKYVTLTELVITIRKNIHKIPHDIDFVIGVPRSGMIAASIISEYLNVPLIDLKSFCKGATANGGDRLGMNHKEASNKVLVIDDTVNSGKSLSNAQAMLAGFDYEFIYGVVYLEGWNDKIIDFYLEDLRQYTHNFTQIVIYEWNVFHHYNFLMGKCMYDIDGVLCLDTPDERNTEEYEKYIVDAVPQFTPSVPIGMIVTYRLEKYRKETEEWLKKNGIRYGNLLMFNAQSWDERNKSGISSEAYKSYIYGNSDAVLFIESDDWQAKRIYEMTKKPVLCTDTNRLYGGE